MLSFANLLNYRLVGASSAQARIDDLSVDLQAGDYPPVTHLLWRTPDEALQRLPWPAIRRVDPRRHQIEIEPGASAEPVDEAWLAETVLLKREVLDALMVDLQNRTPVLANDLWLKEEEDRQLRLNSIDIGFRAVVRRLSRGLIELDGRRGQRDWKYIEFLRGDPRAPRAGRVYHGLISRLPAGEIGYLADLLPYLYAAELLALLPDTVAADTLEIMEPELQLQAFEELDEGKARTLLSLMRPDVTADLLGRLEPDQARRWLEAMPPRNTGRVLRLLHYPDDTAGGIMTNDMVTLPEETTAEKAISILHDLLQKNDYINFIQIVYVVDEPVQQRLRGAVSLRDLLVAEKDSPLRAIMSPYLITLRPLEKASEAARRVIESALAALPVINPDNRIIGVVTIDTALSLTIPKRGRREVLRLFS